MPGYDFVSTPSDAVARELEKLGHTIYILSDIDTIVPNKVDFVWSPYESVTVLGDALSRIHKAPHFSHIEWLPPWRVVQDCNIEIYGYKEREVPFEQSYNSYKKIVDMYNIASIKTISSKEFLKYMFDAYHLEFDANNFIFRAPSIDYETIKKARSMYTPMDRPKNRVITIARAVPNKRYDLMCSVINNIKTEIEWVIVGSGPTLDLIDKNVNNKNVFIKKIGPQWGFGKYYWLLSSTVFLGAWSGMPPVEAELLGAKSFLIRPQNTKEVNITAVFNELFNNQIFNDTDPISVAKEIDSYLSNPIKDDSFETMFLNNGMGVTTAKQNAINIVKLMEGIK
jgi:glycosyltransferase involved in cell wall biosynthesis